MLVNTCIKVKFECCEHWLAQEGYEVQLIDPVPLHVERARLASEAQPGAAIKSCATGDARHLEIESNTANAVLLMGPMYHLTETADRMQALAEAYRVLSPGGLLFASAISRFASTDLHPRHHAGDGIGTGPDLCQPAHHVRRGKIRGVVTIQSLRITVVTLCNKTGGAKTESPRQDAGSLPTS
jgi:ubiquinone/menaquinone biosynthesis C-methylase UbiE